jgi:hypothetical protein
MARERSNMTDDENLWRQFKLCTLPKEQWNHSAHVKVAYLHLQRHTLDETIPILRAGIKALNKAHGVVDTPTRGYHETMTQAWLRVIAAKINQSVPADSAETFLQSQPQLRQSNLLQTYYSQPWLMSAEAKAQFVEPDLAPLP